MTLERAGNPDNFVTLTSQDVTAYTSWNSIYWVRDVRLGFLGFRKSAARA
jgi:hypothetical protein